MKYINIPDGIEKSIPFIIEDRHCISRLDEGLPTVLATFVIVEWIEIVSALILFDYIDSEWLTVGSNINIDHLAIAVPGQVLMVETKIVERHRGDVLFNAVASVGAKIISRATHRRTLVPRKIIDRQISKEKVL
ncbi:MAG TPA: hypothetical protein HPP80_01690 [Rhodospirillaceae bacterium]|nr:hypothetical protein [Rhodospirillaceae bacterium]